MAYTGAFPDAFPYLYQEGWIQALQQKSARSRPYVNTIPMNGKSKRFHKINKVESEQITARFGETNPGDIGIDYRTLYVNFHKTAKRVDRREAMQLGQVGGPQMAIMQAQMAAANRSFDQTLINGLTGVAYEGENGETQVAFPSSQEVGVGYVHSGSTANSGLTFDKLNRVIEMFGEANVTGQDVEGGSNLIGLITHRQITDLRNEQKLTSGDYQAIKPLAGPNMFDVFGITLVAVDPSLLPHNSGTDVRTCVFYAKDHVAFGVAEQPMTRVSELVDGNYDIQLYAEWGWGCTRLFDEAVIEVFCDESP